MAFIPSRIKRHDTDPGEVKLTLTSMMDMFTIILVFLLKTYSTDGHLVSPSEFLTLPQSTVEQHAEVAMDLVVSKQIVMVNNEPVALVADIAKGDPAVVEGGIIKPLRDRLRYYSREAKKLETDYGIRFSGKVTIQGDKDLAYSELVKVMRTCGVSDYPNMRLLVYREGE